jgi:hypothetical protein
MNRIRCLLGLLAIAALPATMFSDQQPAPPITPPVITVPAGSAAVEQTTQGKQPAALLVESFDGLGVGFEGPQGTAMVRNPSDNSLAVGPDHIVQTVNTRTAIFTKKGKKFDTTGKVLYGPVNNNNFFKDFGGQCEARNNGDTVVRYDQIADRWLVVMPLFGRGPVREDQPPAGKGSDVAYVSPPGRPGQPGKAVPLFQPPPPPPAPPAAPAEPGQRGQRGGGRGAGPDAPQGPYSMCYAISVGPDPLGPYYRYEFLRPLFPTTHGRPSGRMATTFRRAPVTIGFRTPSRRRSTRASSIARRCSRASLRPSSAW